MNRTALRDNILFLMLENNETQNSLASKINVAPGTVNNWLNSKRLPSSYAVYRMSKVFNVPMETIMKGIDEDEL